MRIGIKEIFEELRQAIASEKREDDFKLNNNWTSVYARLLAYKYPELSKRLELRTVYAWVDFALRGVGNVYGFSGWESHRD